MRQIRENKHCGKKTVLQLASGGCSPPCCSQCIRKSKHMNTKVIITRPTIQIRLAQSEVIDTAPIGPEVVPSQVN